MQYYDAFINLSVKYFYPNNFQKLATICPIFAKSPLFHFYLSHSSPHSKRRYPSASPRSRSNNDNDDNNDNGGKKQILRRERNVSISKRGASSQLLPTSVGSLPSKMHAVQVHRAIQAADPAHIWLEIWLKAAPAYQEAQQRYK